METRNHQAPAQALLRQAVRNGTVVRPTVCSRCGAEAAVHAHHDDYHEPLDVVWLCASCHALRHRKQHRTGRPVAACNCTIDVEPIPTALPSDEQGFLLYVLKHRARRTRGRSPGSPTCRCGQPKRITRWLCDPCYAAYRRDYRTRWSDPPRTGEALLRARARSYAHTYLRRGLIEREPCAVCGSDRAIMRHHDYTKPLEVHWTCKECNADAVLQQWAAG